MHLNYFVKFKCPVAETQIPQRHRTLGGISGPSCKVFSEFQVRFVACIEHFLSRFSMNSKVLPGTQVYWEIELKPKS